MVTRLGIPHPDEVVSRLCLREGKLIWLVQDDRFAAARDLFPDFFQQLWLEAFFHLAFPDVLSTMQLSAFDEALFVHLGEGALTWSFGLDVVNYAKLFHKLPELGHFVILPVADWSSDDWFLELIWFFVD